jgi:protein kinase A
MENLKAYRTTRTILPPLTSRSFFIRNKINLRKSQHLAESEVSSSLASSHRKNRSMSPVKRPISLSPQKVRSSLITENSTRKSSNLLKCAWTLDKLEFGKVLGRGKLGRVLQAKLDFLEVAVKIMPQELKKYASIETEIMSMFSHPLIISSYGDLEDKDSVYILLEYISTGDLFHIMRKRRLRQNEITFYAAELLVILDMLHCKNVVYRDLKPENVMVCETGHLKLIDFGLSKILQEDRTYTLCGSPEYMAPEVLTKQGYSFSVDYWALGVLIYELYCG